MKSSKNYLIFLIYLKSISVLILLNSLDSSAQSYQISYLSVNDGLSQNEVTSIVKDDYGFMWFGTRGGLNRYDGYDFKSFKPSGDSLNTIVNPSIERLYCDNDSKIWIGTKSGGLSYYDIKRKSFSNQKISRSSSRIISFYRDQDQVIWVGTWRGGLLRISGDSVTHYLGDLRVYSIAESNDGTIWLGTGDGLRYLEKESKTFKRLLERDITEIVIDGDYLWFVGWDKQLSRLNRENLSLKVFTDNPALGKATYSLFLSDNGELFVGTWGKGLFIFDKSEECFLKVDISPQNIIHSAGYDIILDIYQDNMGDIWLGTHAGVVKLSSESNFNLINVIDDESLIVPYVSAVFVDSKGVRWLGTADDGLYYSYKDGDFIKVKFKRLPKFKSKNKINIKAIFEDPQSRLWISIDGGLFLVDRGDDNSFQLISADTLFIEEEYNIIRKVHDIHWEEDYMWIGTQQRGTLLLRWVDGRYKLVRHFKSNRKLGSIGSNRVTSIQKDSNSNLWFATYRGLYRFSNIDSTFTDLKSVQKDDLHLISDIILCSYKDRESNIWFGTPSGLNMMHIDDGGSISLDVYSKNDGLSDDYINGVLEDKQGLIWVSTNSGLSSIDPKSREVRNYGKSDGVGNDYFKEAACCIGDDGTLYFGGSSMLIYFNPPTIHEDINSAPIVITKFSILNREVPIRDSGILSKNINDIERLRLTHKESEFSFEFALLDYKTSKNNLYSYKLSGQSDKWINIGNRRHISFSNLDPGDYTLQIKGTNSNGIWSSNIKQLNIRVEPAPWKTWYAVVSYILTILGGVILISRLWIKKERLENGVKVDRLKRKQERELNEYKFQFFTNISHELRTPLTLILAPINELLSAKLSNTYPSSFKPKLQLIHRNANTLYNTINQLLEFRRIESGKLKLKVSKIDLKSHLIELLTDFKLLAESRGGDLTSEFTGSDWICYVDVNKIDIVINNLLSNALKYSGDPGEVNVFIKSDGEFITFKVINDGVHISKTEMPHLFERFYQTGSHSTRGSSGIGLALVKTYVELHKGDILVESEPNKTTFTIIIKRGYKHLPIEDIQDSAEEVPVTEGDRHLPIESVQGSAKETSLNREQRGDLALVLVVEDNSDLRSYLVSLLLDQYEVIEATNGQDGYKLALERKPSLIISDIMMPLMDGFELCQKVKKSELISQIPIILLTAKITDQDKLLGAKIGADAYVTKPFNPDLLIEKIKSLIASRRELFDKFSRRVVLAPTDAEITLEESKFIEDSLKIIEESISDVGFDTEQLALRMAMSPSTLYRKTKKITKKTPGEYLKSIRLKRAAQLLKDSDMSVSEISESIGYTDIKSFRLSFKRNYKVNPLDYRIQHR